ncbi:hypothetical protein BHM03_00026178 [Ensete ventricosum]|uniref:Uncharacterized protein n=1 Tax=Ensete ventricosum TaxID=4639 RepID=A0A445MH80_ENSVE|nr:hypothetical protein BHM03_00026178 [Ensete ventricosum]
MILSLDGGRKQGLQHSWVPPVLCSTTGSGCFYLVIARNRSVTVDFDHPHPLSGSINRGRRKKEEEGEEKGEPRDPIPLSLDDPDLSPVGRRSLGRLENKLRRHERPGNASLKCVAWSTLEALGPHLASPKHPGERPSAYLNCCS